MRTPVQPAPPTLADDIRTVREIPQAHFPDPLCRCVACSANRLADRIVGSRQGEQP